MSIQFFFWSENSSSFLGTLCKGLYAFRGVGMENAFLHRLFDHKVKDLDALSNRMGRKRLAMHHGALCFLAILMLRPTVRASTKE